MKIQRRMALSILMTFTMGSMSATVIKTKKGGSVAFDHLADSSLIVVPVMINNHGPYKFLLDTGTTKTIVSTKIADKLGIPKTRIEMLFSAGGNLPVAARILRILEVGATRVENVEIASGNLPLMKTLNVDGLLGNDYLRRFKVSIDYDNGVVDLQPCCDDSLSLLVG
jgi:predicted aspartyl protease